MPREPGSGLPESRPRPRSNRCVRARGSTQALVVVLPPGRCLPQRYSRRINAAADIVVAASSAVSKAQRQALGHWRRKRLRPSGQYRTVGLTHSSYGAHACSVPPVHGSRSPSIRNRLCPAVCASAIEWRICTPERSLRTEDASSLTAMSSRSRPSRSGAFSTPPGNRLTLILAPDLAATSSANFHMPIKMGCPFGFCAADFGARSRTSCAALKPAAAVTSMATANLSIRRFIVCIRLQDS